MAAQIGAIAASTLLGVSVILVVANLLLSLRGSGIVPRDIGLRFVATSTVFYLVVSIQGALQAQMSVNQAVHFSDWVIGHSHLAMLGFATFAGIGGIVHAWQRMPSARYNARALEWGYWLLVGGVVLMFVDLTLAGLVRGARLAVGRAVARLGPRGAGRTGSSGRSRRVPIAAGFIALLVGLTTRSARRRSARRSTRRTARSWHPRAASRRGWPRRRAEAVS